MDLGVPADLIVTHNDLWEGYVASEEYSKWRHDIEISYVWDKLILRLHNFHVTQQLTEKRRLELEESVRYINLEPRINRIELGSVWENAKERQVSGRMLRPLEGAKHAYVLIPLTDKNWERKETVLKLRCVVARVENPKTEKIIGISLGSNSNGENHFDICYLDIPILDEELINYAKEIQDEFGYFKNLQVTHSKSFRK